MPHKVKRVSIACQAPYAFEKDGQGILKVQSDKISPSRFFKG
jgi:hypothetical protein